MLQCKFLLFAWPVLLLHKFKIQCVNRKKKSQPTKKSITSLRRCGADDEILTTELWRTNINNQITRGEGTAAGMKRRETETCGFYDFSYRQSLHLYHHASLIKAAPASCHASNRRTTVPLYSMLLHINDTNADGWFCGYYFVSLYNLLILLLACDIVRLQSDSVYQELRLYVRFYEGISDVRLLLRSSTARGVTAARMSAVEVHVKHLQSPERTFWGNAAHLWFMSVCRVGP